MTDRDLTPVRGKSAYAAAWEGAAAPEGRRLMIAIVRLILPRWRVAAIVFFTILAITVAVLLVVHRRYTSTAAFVVEAPPTGAMGSAMAIISQLNPNLAGGDSPKFYVDLVQSRHVLEALLQVRPHARCDGDGGLTLLERLDPSGDTPLERQASALETIRSRVGSGYDLRTGVITVSVEARCPALAAELVDSLLGQVNNFNVDRRQSRAKLRREFADDRATEAENTLRAAEDQLAGFLATNRVVASPQLKLESDRLERRITMRSEMATALRREASTARLDEINAIPVITVIDPPDVPVRASYPRRRVIAIVVAFFAIFIALGSALGVGLRAPLAENEDLDVVRLHASVRRVAQRLRSPRK